MGFCRGKTNGETNLRRGSVMPETTGHLVTAKLIRSPSFQLARYKCRGHRTTLHYFLRIRSAFVFIRYPAIRSLPLLLSIRMSSCDCDRKDSNGGNCDSSCKEETFFVTANSSSPSFTPVLAATKPAATLESASFDCCSAAPCSI